MRNLKEISRTKKENFGKHYDIVLWEVTIDSDVPTIFGNVKKWYAVAFDWFNLKRQMQYTKSFKTIEEAQNYYNKKIDVLEKKIA